MEQAEEVVEVIPWQVEFLPSAEWMNRALGLFSSTLSWIMANQFLRLFAVLSVLILVVNLLYYLVRSGKSLSY